MRWMMLAAATIAVSASPAFAQKVTYQSRTPTHRATYARSEVSPVRYVGATHTEAVVDGSGCTSCNSCSDGGCQSGCSSHKKHCCSPLSNLVDNIADVFVALKPCPSHCGPCVRPVHSCPYPRVNAPSNCCNPRLPRLMDSIFVCNKRGCNRGCSSGCDQGCSTGCSSGCAQGIPHGMQPADELLTPPSAPPMLKPSPFTDDPIEPMPEASRRIPSKTAAAARPWYKKSNAAPVVAPQAIFVGNATPIYETE